jgi:hypothetical protein
MPYDLCSVINLVRIGLCQQSTRFEKVCSILGHTRGSPKVPGILWKSTIWCTTSSYHLDRVLRVISTCSSEKAARQVAGRDSGFCITITHRARHRLLCSNCSPRKTFLSPVLSSPVLSRSGSEWLSAVLYSENGPQGDTFCKHAGHQIQCDGRTMEDSKRSLPPVLPTMAGSVEQVCVCVCVCVRACVRACVCVCARARWVDTVPDPLFVRKSGSTGNRTRDPGSSARNSDH